MEKSEQIKWHIGFWINMALEKSENHSYPMQNFRVLMKTFQVSFDEAKKYYDELVEMGVLVQVKQFDEKTDGSDIIYESKDLVPEEWYKRNKA